MHLLLQLLQSQYGPLPTPHSPYALRHSPTLTPTHLILDSFSLALTRSLGVLWLQKHFPGNCNHARQVQQASHKLRRSTPVPLKPHSLLSPSPSSYARLCFIASAHFRCLPRPRTSPSPRAEACCSYICEKVASAFSTWRGCGRHFEAQHPLKRQLCPSSCCRCCCCCSCIACLCVVATFWRLPRMVSCHMRCHKPGHKHPHTHTHTHATHPHIYSPSAAVSVCKKATGAACTSCRIHAGNCFTFAATFCCLFLCQVAVVLVVAVALSLNFNRGICHCRSPRHGGDSRQELP